MLERSLLMFDKTSREVKIFFKSSKKSFRTTSRIEFKQYSESSAHVWRGERGSSGGFYISDRNLILILS